MTGAALLLLATLAAPTRVAITIDDLPWVGPLAPGDTRAAATQRILTALGAHHAPATGFVVCDRVGPAAPIVRAWRAAGLDIGNHSDTHRARDTLDLDAWTADVQRCRDRLTEVLGAPPRYFRFPFLQRGRTPTRREASRAALDSLGHTIAPVDIDTGEWVLVAPYAAALQTRDAATARAIGEAYVEHVVTATRHYRDVAQRRVRRPIAHVLLLHANALAADHLDALLTALEGEGVVFISLEQALADPIYALTDAYAGPIGLSWLYRIAPADAGAWSWDDAQVAGLRRRFETPGDARALTAATERAARARRRRKARGR